MYDNDTPIRCSRKTAEALTVTLRQIVQNGFWHSLCVQGKICSLLSNELSEVKVLPRTTE